MVWSTQDPRMTHKLIDLVHARARVCVCAYVCVDHNLHDVPIFGSGEPTTKYILSFPFSDLSSISPFCSENFHPS